jgi:hypothetical protein
MQGYRAIIAINILAMVIGSVFAVCFVGRDGGAGKASAGNTAGEDATAKDGIGKDLPNPPTKDTAATVTTGSTVAAASDDAVAVTAIAGSPEVFLSFAGETVNATPFIPDLGKRQWPELPTLSDER